MITEVAQRWRDRVGSYRLAREPFDPRAHEVAAVPDAVAKAFVECHHYSGSYPAARWRFGLFNGAALVGVAVVSEPVNALSLRPFGHDVAAELGRLVLLDHVLANGESWFIARVLDLLRRAGLSALVSFSDPVARTQAHGEVVFPGHIGGVYQATNALYTGRSAPNTIRLLPDGRAFNKRTMSKVRGRERGWRHAVEQLVSHGARPPQSGADLAEWLRRELPAVTRPLRHGGNHRYLFPLDRAARRAAPDGLPYPKFSLDAAIGGAR
jgi:hypothetical protein